MATRWKRAFLQNRSAERYDATLLEARHKEDINNIGSVYNNACAVADSKKCAKGLTVSEEAQAIATKCRLGRYDHMTIWTWDLHRW